MNKHTGIVIIASIVIIGSVGYSLFNATTLNELQFKWNDRGSFDYLAMLNGGFVEFCNASSVPLSFEKLQFVTFYQGEEVGQLEIQAATIQPNSLTEIKGEGQMTSLAGQMISMFMDTEISGRDIARIDSTQMVVFTVIDTTILGVIPYSITNQYTGEEFFEIMNGNNKEYSC